jgi:hypothetical protein
MKRILFIALALALVACLGMVASAETLDVTTKDRSTTTVSIVLDETNADVTATATVYSVDVAWTAATFTYEVTETSGAGSVMTWNPQTHTYEVLDGTSIVSGAWTADSELKVTVTNHSNAKVHATVELPAVTNGVTFSEKFGTRNIDLARADEGESLNNPTMAPEHQFTVVPSGKPTGSFNVEVGIILGKVN